MDPHQIPDPDPNPGLMFGIFLQSKIKFYIFIKLSHIITVYTNVIISHMLFYNGLTFFSVAEPHEVKVRRACQFLKNFDQIPKKFAFLKTYISKQPIGNINVKKPMTEFHLCENYEEN
jgi:hypothetical protein